jgi:hypothetical protein
MVLPYNKKVGRACRRCRRVAVPADQPYVSRGQEFEAMPATVPTATLSRPAILLAGFAGVLLACTIGLWAFYGTAVFFETVRTGWIACF